MTTELIEATAIYDRPPFSLVPLTCSFSCYRGLRILFALYFLFRSPITDRAYRGTGSLRHKLGNQKAQPTLRDDYYNRHASK